VIVMRSGNTALPVAEFEDLPAESLEARIRPLDIQQLEQLIGHELLHANRPEVLEVLNRRLDRLKAGTG